MSIPSLKFISLAQSLLLLLFFLFPVSGSADIIKGQVVDSDDFLPLEGSIVEIQESVPNSVMMRTTIETDSTGIFLYECIDMTVLTINIHHLGYNSHSIRLIGSETGDTIDLGKIQLKMSDIMLKEINVKGHKKRFILKGDTVIFNPDAFQLDDGDRIISLVRKLPGVIEKDGVLYWMNEPLKIMMNGKDIFNGNILLNRIPAVAVDNIKTYEKDSELTQRTKAFDGKKNRVLDLSIKKNYMEKWYGESKNRLYLSKTFSNEISGVKLSDNKPLIIYARVAKDMLYTDNKNFNGQDYEVSLLPVKQQIGALGYGHNWKPKIKTIYDNSWNITSVLNHYDKNEAQQRKTQTYLANNEASIIDIDSKTQGHIISVPIKFTSFVNLDSLQTIKTDITISYQKESKRINTNKVTSQAGTTKNQSDYQSLRKNNKLKSNIHTTLTRYFPNGSFSAQVSGFYIYDVQNENSTTNYIFTSFNRAETDRQASNKHDKNFGLDMELSCNHKLGISTMSHFSWNSYYGKIRQFDERSRDDKNDLSNSFNMHNTSFINTFNMEIERTAKTVNFIPTLTITSKNEHLNYHRAYLDTLAKRNVVLFHPQIHTRYRINSQMGFSSDLSYENRPAELIECLNYKDDTDLLTVKEGNTKLIDEHSIGMTLIYTFIKSRNNQTLNLGLAYNRVIHPIRDYFYYEPSNGSYHVQKKNYQGGHQWNFNYNYDCTILNKVRLQNNFRFTWGEDYGELQTYQLGNNAFSVNKQKAININEELITSYDSKQFNVTWRNNYKLQHIRYSNMYQTPFDIHHFLSHMSCSVNINKWKINLSYSLKMNRGYSSSLFNRPQHIISASSSYRFWKNRATLLFEMNDPLNQSRRENVFISSTQYSETHQEFMHNYIAATFRYRIEPVNK